MYERNLKKNVRPSSWVSCISLMPHVSGAFTEKSRNLLLSRHHKGVVSRYQGDPSFDYPRRESSFGRVGRLPTSGETALTFSVGNSTRRPFPSCLILGVVLCVKNLSSFCPDLKFSCHWVVKLSSSLRWIGWCLRKKRRA